MSENEPSQKIICDLCHKIFILEDDEIQDINYCCKCLMSENKEKLEIWKIDSSMTPFWLETLGKKEQKGFIVLDTLMVQRNEDGSLYIVRSQYDIKKQRHLPEEEYILKKSTKNKIVNICMKLSDIRREIEQLGDR